MDLKARLYLAERVRASADAVAEEVTDRFLQRHPDWVARYGERARRSGIADARYHVTFLAAALESAAPAAFADYARWTARVLESRGIRQAFLVENLGQVREALAARFADGSQPIDEYVSVAVEALRQAANVESVTAAGARTLTCSMYLQAVLAGERTAALTVLTEALREGASALDLYVDVLQAALYEVGRLWETNQITVAHEHAATAITQFVAAHLYPHLDRCAAPRRGTILITGLEGELHNVGALMVADVLEAEGWGVRFLGTSLPQQAILDAIRERQPDCVGISATMLFNVPALRRLIEAVRREWGTSKRIVLGGGAFRHAPGLWRELGADAHAGDLREALAVMRT